MNNVYGEELNSTEKKLLKYITEYISKRGISPSLREISKYAKIKSPTTVRKYLDILNEKGYINIVLENNRMIGINVKDNLFVDKTNKDRKTKLDKIKTASIPLFGRIYEKNNLFTEINYEELISVPVSIGMEENLFAFKNISSELTEVGMPKSSIIIVDKKTKPIHGDFVAKYIDGQFNIIKYQRGEDEHIVGKIIGSYTDITY